jgi:hypothetical protein
MASGASWPLASFSVRRSPTALQENIMKKTLTALSAAGIIAGTLISTMSEADAQWRRRGGGWAGPAIVGGILGGAIITGALMANRPRGYVVYEGYDQPVQYRGCYWASEPVYNQRGQVVGYTGQPVQVCPGYRPY